MRCSQVVYYYCFENFTTLFKLLLHGNRYKRLFFNYLRSIEYLCMRFKFTSTAQFCYFHQIKSGNVYHYSYFNFARGVAREKIYVLFDLRHILLQLFKLVHIYEVICVFDKHISLTILTYCITNEISFSIFKMLPTNFNILNTNNTSCYLNLSQKCVFIYLLKLSLYC